MNTVQLECFVSVAEHLNFSKASKVLKITQPAVSHQIQTLEEELEVKLFHRTSKSVSLTQEGILFLADAQLILKTALSAKERLGMREHFIPFELGCHNHMELNLLPPILKRLMQEFPLLRPSIRLVPFPSLISLVENSQVQAALGIKEESKKSILFFKELCVVPVACVCSPEHPLAQHQTLTKDQLKGNFIACSPRQISNAVFSAQSGVLADLPPEQRFFTENIESALALAKAGIGYTLYPDIPQAREAGLCYLPVHDLPGISFGVYYPYGQNHPVLKRFLTLISRSLKMEDSSNP
ncbi:MAG TPA: LysR family transcriptional regulator [Candidatus Egerieicola faecale]|uniref:LysR family transcriptional regulator n=1 Tax=Candidatus Egerieicola faecale TaxID=2840774 RepID=A0A9D1LKR8_9FIRM|nr:LysR family transcriptional regulator [Candidatus Egerieicola faecale]